jgi:molybdopterin converting factor small subunit
MKVQVLFFGATAEAVGEREISLDLPDRAETKADAAFQQILADYPALKNHKLLFAVNQEYAGGGETIKNGDELAIFTAVSGG